MSDTPLGWVMALAIAIQFLSCDSTDLNRDKETLAIEQKVDSLLSLMTLEEKVGQLNHLKANYSTDIYKQNAHLPGIIKEGLVGALSPRSDIAGLIALQKIAVDSSRLRIPLFYAQDIVHGYRTIFPIPLGQACSWDMQAIEKAERVAAVETSAAGISLTFAPVFDITRDARWGRAMEAAGEDPYLTSQIAKARIRGFQGNDLSQPNTVIACAKHYVGYGAVEAGMEYNVVDMSERYLRQIHLPPFKAAVEEGMGSIMNSFNTIGGVPATSDPLILNQILKTEWAFDGFTISDAHSIDELVQHGVAVDFKEAAYRAFTAGSDTDLWGQVYSAHLPELVREGKIREAEVNESVRRVLRYKYKLGLFDDPYRYLNQKRFEEQIFTEDNRKAALDIATKSIVLLKNKEQLLPISKTKYKRIALIGNLGDSRARKDLMGNWSPFGRHEDIITVNQGLEKLLGPDQSLTHVMGCEHWGECTNTTMKEAEQLAKNSDLLILPLGEQGWDSGECSSRTDITLPGNQEELITRLGRTGKPIILLVFAGRAQVLTDIVDKVDAIMYCWQPGTMAGEAIANLVYGRNVPSAKLTVTLPYRVGQAPIYYAKLNTSRPRQGPDDKRWGVNKWSDAPNEPLFPFGYGLSYTTFEYSDMKIDKSSITFEDTLNISVTVTNKGNYDASEIIQLYLRDKVATVSRPIKELVGFDRVFIKTGESKKVMFQLTIDDLKYWDQNMAFEVEDGEFEVFVGKNSSDLLKDSFKLVDYRPSY
ncbi:MAG: glycoside hydrolase family 3 C-terminal domain-containing protein [Cyclobacteriaceae bacterium]|nr:glycoside hydrolase family 3 C-terminal domain-containing protein [Cyclobacteriaceae bacterium HetDA_MAG_MS6]